MKKILFCVQQRWFPGLAALACIWGRALPKPCAGSHWKGLCLKCNLLNYVCASQRRKPGFWDSQDSCGRQRGGMLNTSGIMTNSDCKVWLCNVWHLGLETASQHSVWKQIRKSVHVCKEQCEILVPKPKSGGKGRKHDYVNNFKFSCLILTFLSIFEHTWLTPAFYRDDPARKKGNIAAPAVCAFIKLWLNAHRWLEGCAPLKFWLFPCAISVANPSYQQTARSQQPIEKGTRLRTGCWEE